MLLSFNPLAQYQTTSALELPAIVIISIMISIITCTAPQFLRGPTECLLFKIHAHQPEEHLRHINHHLWPRPPKSHIYLMLVHQFPIVSPWHHHDMNMSPLSRALSLDVNFPEDPMTQNGEKSQGGHHSKWDQMGSGNTEENLMNHDES